MVLIPNQAGHSIAINGMMRIQWPVPAQDISGAVMVPHAKLL
jgi:hypothetical protein